MSDDDKDPKGGENNSDDSGQSEKKLSTDSEEKVEVSKSELAKLQKKSQDFDGIVESNRKKNALGRTLPGAKPQTDKVVPSDDDGSDDDLTEEFVTKKDFKKQIEKQAIAELHKDPDIADHWEEIMEFYTPRSTDDTDTVEGIVAIGKRALKVYRSEHPIPKEDDKGEDKKIIADIASEKGLGKGKEKNTTTKKKSILPKNEKMTAWYG